MKYKLLIIDNEQGILDSYSELLEDDFEVHTADNVQDGIKQLSSKEYDVAVIDIDFPEAPEGGIDIVKYIESSQLKTRSIILTGKGTVEQFKKLFKNVDDFIEKGSPEYRASTQVLIKALEAVKTHKQHSYFLSYSSEDSGLADYVELLIRRKNRNALRDQVNMRAGDNIPQEIKDMIDKSDTFIALWSKNYADSVLSQNELEYAYGCKKNNQRLSRIILLPLDQTSIPDQASISSIILFKDHPSRELAIRKIIEEENIY